MKPFAGAFRDANPETLGGSKSSRQLPPCPSFNLDFACSRRKGPSMRKVFWWTGGFLLLGVLAGAAFLSNLIWFQPWFIDHYFERVFLETALRNPELLTSTRALKPLGLRFYHDDLQDHSDDASLERVERLERQSTTLRAYQDETLSGPQQLSKDILQAYFEPQLALAEFRHHNYPINQLFGYQNVFPSFMSVQHWIEDRYDAEAYIARLKKLPNAFEQLIEGTKIRAAKGITPPTFVVDKVLGNLQSFVEPTPAENSLTTSFAEKLNATSIDEKEREQLMDEVQKAVEQDVYRAFGTLISFLEDFRNQTNSDDGVWKLPQGDRFYELKLWEMTTTRLPPEEIHRRGLEEVARIQTEMLSILNAEGYGDGENFASAMNALAEDPRHYFSDSTKGRDRILETYRELIDEVEAKLDPWFNLRHRVGVEVLRVPEFREATAPGAYYQSPSLDGDEPGRFFANLYDIRATPKWGMRTLTYHEAVPGHHLQRAVASEVEGLPTFRRLIPFTAFTEGWALYAERLAYEMGLMEDPLDNLGRLQAELFRAVRLVVDTGIHRFRWNRDKAISYMKTNLGSADSDVEAEVERYIVMPAQATAYKVGMDFILDQRRRSQEALGEAFQHAEFHDAVLRNGAVPLSILAEQIDAYIAEKQLSLGSI